VTVTGIGLLVMRAWMEEGSHRPLRVEVRLTADTCQGFEPELTFSEPVAVKALVRAWLDAVLAGGDGNDSLRGGPGNHQVLGDRDQLSGGAGRDSEQP
jgi:hypothetical protein